MKELDPLNLPHDDKTEQVVQFPKTTKPVFNQAKPHNGMFLFGFEIVTGNCEHVKFEVSSLPHKVKNKNPLPMRKFTDELAEKSLLTIERVQINHKVTAKQGWWYVWAINEKSGLKKFRKAFP